MLTKCAVLLVGVFELAPIGLVSLQNLNSH